MNPFDNEFLIDQIFAYTTIAQKFILRAVCHKFYVKIRPTGQFNLSHYAIQTGNFELLKYAHKLGHPVRKICTAMSTNPEIVRFIHDNHCTKTSAAINYLIKNLQYLGNIERLRNHGCIFDESTVNLALDMRRLDIMTDLIDRGYKVNEDLVISIVRQDRFVVLNCLLEYNCPITIRTFIEAIKAEAVACLPMLQKYDPNLFEQAKKMQINN